MYLARLIRYLCNFARGAQRGRAGQTAKKQRALTLLESPLLVHGQKRGADGARRAIFSAPKSRVRPGRNI